MRLYIVNVKYLYEAGNRASIIISPALKATQENMLSHKLNRDGGLEVLVAGLP